VKIQFIPASQQVESVTEAPAPAKYSIPDWYKKVMPDPSNPNIKACMPFLDALVSGYVQKTWADIYVEESSEGLTINASHEQALVTYREPNQLPELLGYYHFQFLWNSVWSPVLPPNFSGLITHPLNRIDLPFYTFAGVVEFDEFKHVPVGNLPFYIKKGFTGLIPKGTPMYQIIPFARTDWKATVERYRDNFWPEKVAERNLTPHWYKKKIWKKKEFTVG